MNRAARRWSSALFFLAALALYALTAAPGMGTEDSAELTGGARFLTMVHAPGYPLYLLAGRLFTALSPIPGRGLVLFSVLAASLGVGLLHWLVKRHWGEMAGAVAALSLLFCVEFWQAATGAEVYALSVFFLVALLGALLELERRPATAGRSLRLLGLLTGLALAHHIGLLIHLPAILCFVAWTLRDRVPRPRAIAAALGYLVLGLLAYLALPLLSRPGMPIISWEPVTSLGRLVHVATGAGFKRLLFAVPLPQVGVNLLLFPLAVLAWFPVLSVLAAALGLAQAWRREKAFGALLVAIAAVTVIHAANYDVLDPERFLVPAMLPVVFLAGLGWRWIAERRTLPERIKAGIVILFAITPLFGRLATGTLVNAAFHTLALDLPRAVLDDLSGPDSAVLWSDWRFFPGLRYIQLAENRGTNVLIEMDSTAKTPGDSWLPGRTYTMHASPDMGRQYALSMEKLAWRVETGVPDAPRTRDTAPPLLTLGGISVTGVSFPPRARFGEPIRTVICFRRDGEVVSDTVAGDLILKRNGRRVLVAPFQFWHWHAAPATLTPGVRYDEPVSLLVPTGLRGLHGRFTLSLRLYEARHSRAIDLGEIEMTYGKVQTKRHHPACHFNSRRDNPSKES